VVTLVHLSDIHFKPRDDQAQLDLDQHIRRTLIEDLESKPAESDYDGILITGDIAYAGKIDEYKAAQDWLDKLFSKTGMSRSDTYMVPGNHDVDRDYVDPSFPLWDSHARLREKQSPVDWRDVIAKQLKQDPLHSLLAPLGGYNDFAQGYDCRTKPDQLAWHRVFPKSLDDELNIRLHGLNSALISDSGDAPGKLLVSEFQTAHFERSVNTIDIALCHHPPEWLMDKFSLGDALHAFTPIALFGHEHNTRIVPEPKHIQLFAGAVQPSRRDPENWLPTYHILQLSPCDREPQSQLKVRIYTREFNKHLYRFQPRRNEDEEKFEEHRLRIPIRPRKPVVTLAADHVSAGDNESSDQPIVEAAMSTKVETAKRELLVHFFRLKTPDRYAAANEAGLLRDGDDSLQPQTMWAEVFKRATDEAEGLVKFWNAVASRDNEIRELPNPFKE